MRFLWKPAAWPPLPPPQSQRGPSQLGTRPTSGHLRPGDKYVDNTMMWDRDYNNTDISDVVKAFTFPLRGRLGCVFCICQIQMQIGWVGRSTTFPLGGGSGWSFLERRSSMMSSGTMPSMEMWSDKYLKCVSDTNSHLIWNDKYWKCSEMKWQIVEMRIIINKHLSSWQTPSQAGIPWSTQQQLHQWLHGTENIFFCIQKFKWVVMISIIKIIIRYLASLVTDNDWNSWTLK